MLGYILKDGTLDGGAKSILNDLSLLIQKFHPISPELNSLMCEIFLSLWVVAREQKLN